MGPALGSLDELKKRLAATTKEGLLELERCDALGYCRLNCFTVRVHSLAATWGT